MAKLGYTDIPATSTQWEYSKSEVKAIMSRLRRMVFPSIVLDPAAKRSSAIGPAKWIVPVHLLRPLQGALTALIHMIMATPPWREVFLARIFECAELNDMQKCAAGLWKEHRVDAKAWAVLQRRTSLCTSPTSLATSSATRLLLPNTLRWAEAPWISARIQSPGSGSLPHPNRH